MTGLFKRVGFMTGNETLAFDETLHGWKTMATYFGINVVGAFNRSIGLRWCGILQKIGEYEKDR